MIKKVSDDSQRRRKEVRTFVLRCCLDERLHRVRREASCKAQHDLASDETTRVPIAIRAAEADKHTHGDAEEAHTSYCEPLDVADIADDEADEEASEDGHKRIEERNARGRENCLVKGHDDDRVEIARRPFRKKIVRKYYWRLTLPAGTRHSSRRRHTRARQY